MFNDSLDGLIDVTQPLIKFLHNLFYRISGPLPPIYLKGMAVAILNIKLSTNHPYQSSHSFHFRNGFLCAKNNIASQRDMEGNNSRVVFSCTLSIMRNLEVIFNVGITSLVFLLDRISE